MCFNPNDGFIVFGDFVELFGLCAACCNLGLLGVCLGLCGFGRQMKNPISSSEECCWIKHEGVNLEASEYCGSHFGRY